jgi:hypothetical protein
MAVPTYEWAWDVNNVSSTKPWNNFQYRVKILVVETSSYGEQWGKVQIGKAAFTSKPQDSWKIVQMAINNKQTNKHFKAKIWERRYAYEIWPNHAHDVNCTTEKKLILFFVDLVKASCEWDCGWTLYTCVGESRWDVSCLLKSGFIARVSESELTA